VISRTSHPYTGKSKLIDDTAGRIDKFKLNTLNTLNNFNLFSRYRKLAILRGFYANNYFFWLVADFLVLPNFQYSLMPGSKKK
jgi:hypothetical protein